MDLHLTPALEERLEHLAAQVNRGSEDLANEGVERFLAYREDLERAVEQGRLAAAQGELIDHEEAMRLMDQIIEHG